MRTDEEISRWISTWRVVRPREEYESQTLQSRFAKMSREESTRWLVSFSRNILAGVQLPTPFCLHNASSTINLIHSTVLCRIYSRVRERTQACVRTRVNRTKHSFLSKFTPTMHTETLYYRGTLIFIRLQRLVQSECALVVVLQIPPWFSKLR